VRQKINNVLIPKTVLFTYAHSSRMDYVRYLRSKRTVDDRAINLRVLDNLKDILKNRALPAVIKNGFHLRVLEIGAGVGSMLIRLWSLGTFAE
jgi:hypothetical protein